MRFTAVTMALAGLVMASIASSAAGKPQNFTGEVSDSVCGAKHMMEGSKADCARACVRKGSTYALVVGDKVYALHTNEKTTLAELDRLAGEQAKVTGTPDGDTIEVGSVSPAK